MSPDQPTPPRSAPEALDDPCLDLLAEPLAAAWQHDAESPSLQLRERVLGRIGRSAQASRAFITVRARHGGAELVANGVVGRILYRSAGRSPRAGEPARVRIVELAAGVRWRADLLSDHVSEWLVLEGAVAIDGRALQMRDFLRLPGAAAPELCSRAGARLYLRESPPAAAADEGCTAVLDAITPWDDFAPGIRRRVLWTDGRQAALLYLAEAGAQVPHHGHGHDEECLMLDGEVFLDDLLLCRGDYQLAPAGTAHDAVSTETGGVLFAHGDLDLDIRTR